MDAAVQNDETVIRLGHRFRGLQQVAVCSLGEAELLIAGFSSDRALARPAAATTWKGTHLARVLGSRNAKNPAIIAFAT